MHNRCSKYWHKLDDTMQYCFPPKNDPSIKHQINYSLVQCSFEKCFQDYSLLFFHHPEQMSLYSWLRFILWHGSARFPSCTRSCIAINRPGVELQLWLEPDCSKMVTSFISVPLLFFPICMYGLVSLVMIHKLKNRWKQSDFVEMSFQAGRQVFYPTDNDLQIS